MREIFMVVAASVLLAACSSTPMGEQSAPVWRNVRRRQARPARQASRFAQADPAVVLPGKAPAVASPLRDPKNILSKRSVFFDYDKYDVKDEYKALVQAHAQYLRGNPGAKMLIQGNTDERGSREYNLALGQRRADAMKQMLLLLGAKEVQIESVSLGEEKPRAQGSTEEVYAQNRRGDILYAGE